MIFDEQRPAVVDADTQQRIAESGKTLREVLDDEDLFKGLKKFLGEKFQHSLFGLESIIRASERYYLIHRNTTSVDMLRRRIQQLNAENDQINEWRPLPKAGEPMMLPQDPPSQLELMHIGRQLEIGIETRVLEFLIQALDSREIGHRFDNAPKPGIRARRRGR